MAFFTTETIVKGHLSTSKPRRALINDPATKKALENIAKNNALDLKDLSLITEYVIIGILPVDELVQELESKFSIPYEAAFNIARQIRWNILSRLAREIASMQPGAERVFLENKQIKDQTDKGAAEALNALQELRARREQEENEVI